MLLSDREIAEGRRLAQGEMLDTCRIVRVAPVGSAPGGGGDVLDETTGQYPSQADTDLSDAVTVYEGPCRIQIRADINANIVEPQELEREWAWQGSTLQLPVADDDRIVVGTSGEVQHDDVCLYLSSRYDPSLPGRRFNVQATTHKSSSSIRRFRIREATG